MMKKRRVFIAVNLPDRAKKRLIKIQSGWAGLPVRLTGRENLHVTLVFLGDIDDEGLLEAIAAVREVAVGFGSFSLKLNRVCLAPPRRPPRMIWAKGGKCQKLSELKEGLRKNLFNFGFRQRNETPMMFEPHITLARMRQNHWIKEMGQEAEKDISISFSVESIEVMESVLSRKGPEYFVLESISLE